MYPLYSPLSDNSFFFQRGGNTQNRERFGFTLRLMREN